MRPLDAAPRRRWALLLGLCGLCLLPSIWSETSVTGQDEYWLTLRTPLEMLAGGHFWTPFLNGEPRLRKPPLIYWWVALVYQTLGANLFAARLVGVIAASCLVATAVELSKRLGARAPLLAGLVVLSSAGVAIEGRRAMLDLPLAAGVGLVVLVGARFAERPKPLNAALLGALLGLTTLIKGPVALLFAGTALLAAAWTFPGPAKRSARPIAVTLGLLGFLAVALPWPLSMQALWPQFGEIVGQEAGARQVSFLPIVSIGPVLGGLFGNALPWSFVLLGGLASALWQPRSLSPAARFFARWCLLAALPFLFFKSFERYLIPLCLPMACLVAEQLAHSARLGRSLRGALWLAALPAFALCLLAGWFGHLWWPLLAGALVLGWGRAMAADRNAPAAASAAALVLAIALGWAYPAIGINQVPAGIESHAAGRAVFAFDGTQPAMLSMRLQRSVQPLQSLGTRAEEARLQAAFAAPAVIYLEATAFEKLATAAARHGAKLERLAAFEGLFARKNWVKFARRGATGADWLRAFRERSWSPLSTELLVLSSEPGS